ncbi:MAG: hypothetical protein H6698_02210 [Myxococcales bacterium]|nr:hypothetical protein [Myxococcales bacterium]MCB9519964.1 hypothetical protein [Myxococcales bacterium]MCB9532511.1 hypothetical protein [Myxococcales bacterium]MCB9533125.1 hypothetical protein [Myxococcales bacterium]
MAKKIKAPRVARPTAAAITAPLPPLAAVLVSIAAPVLGLLNDQPQTPLVQWALGAVAAAWNASREPSERMALQRLDELVPGLLTPAFSDPAELVGPLEKTVHLARVNYPRDPRFATRLWIERVVPGQRVPVGQVIAGHFVEAEAVVRAPQPE